MEFTITFNDTAAAALQRLREGVSGDLTTLHDSMAMGVNVAVKEHFEDSGLLRKKNALGGKSTGFWRKVSDSVKTSASAEQGTVSITERGFALQLFGGIVEPVTRKALSIPVHKSAHGLNASEYPDKLAFIPATTQFGPFRKGGGQETVGYLVRGVERTVTRGKNKGQTRTVPMARPAGELIYVLRTRTYHEPHPDVLPTNEAMIAAAADAGGAYLDSLAQ